MTYYTIYRDVFNVILLGIFFDDQQAILEDGLSGKYYLSVKFLCFCVGLWICIKVYVFCISRIKSPLLSRRKLCVINLFLLSVFFCLMLACINSNLSFGNKSLDRDLTPTSNIFLRKITPSPFRSLYQVYKGYRAGNQASFSTFTSKTLDQTIQDFFRVKTTNLGEALAQYSLSTQNQPSVDHIFYIVAESFGNFVFDSKYDEIGLVSGIKSLIDDQKGFRIQNLFESAPATIWSMESQIGGVYYTGVRLGFQSAEPLLTAPAENFRRAGFQTYFYYGGSETWQNLINLAQSQGFGEVFGVGKMEPFAKTMGYPNPYRNVWGVWDNILFDFVAHQVGQSKIPTFNMILTTTFHGPYNLPWKYIEEQGIERQKFEEFVRLKAPEWDPLEFATLWWVDKQIVHFVQKMSQKFPRSLFVITGDHSVARFSQNYQSFKEVGTVFYSPSLRLKQIGRVGDHLDIAATLLALSTPKDFKYFSFGQPLFSLAQDFDVVSQRRVVGFEISGNAKRIYIQNGNMINLENGIMSKVDNQKQAEYYLQRLRDGQALSWYLFAKEKKNIR